jgi:hypothetical protein
MEQTATLTTAAKWLWHVQFCYPLFLITSSLFILLTKVTNLIVSYCVINQINVLQNAVQSHFKMRFKIKCQYWKPVLSNKGKRIPIIYIHISDLTSNQCNTVSGTGKERTYVFQTIHKSRNLSSETKTVAFSCFDGSCTYKLPGVGFCSPDSRRTKIRNLKAIKLG